MAEVITCPVCGQRYRLNEDATGKLLQCPQCSAMFRPRPAAPLDDDVWPGVGAGQPPPPAPGGAPWSRPAPVRKPIPRWAILAGIGGGVLGLLHWITDRQILVGSYLVDLDRRGAVWHYIANLHPPSAPADAVWVGMTLEGAYTLGRVRLPDRPAREALARAPATPLEPLLKAGDKVRIELNDVPQSEQVRADLAKRLHAGGLILDDGATLALQVTRKSETGKERTYRIFNTLNGVREVTVSVTTVRDRYAWGDAAGQTLWTREATVTNDPGYVNRIPEGKTLQEMMQARLPDRLQWIAVPTRVYPEMKDTILGSSGLSPTGTMGWTPKRPATRSATP